MDLFAPPENHGKRRKARAYARATELDPSTNMAVWGFQCDIFDDEETALYLHAGKHLIPCLGNEDTTVDRYDVRNLLPDLSFISIPSKEIPNLLIAEGETEEALERERYQDLDPARFSLMEEEEEEEMEQVKRQRMAEASGSGANYRMAAFSYDQDDTPATSGPEEVAGGSGWLPPPPRRPAGVGASSSSLTGQKSGGEELGAAAGAVRREAERESNSDAPAEPFVPDFFLPDDLQSALPPSKKVHKIITQTAKFVREKPQIEFVLRVKHAENPNFGFIMPTHRMHPYFRYLVNHPPPPSPSRGPPPSAQAAPTSTPSVAFALVSEDYGAEDTGVDGKEDGQEKEGAVDSTIGITEVLPSEQTDVLAEAVQGDASEEGAAASEGGDAAGRAASPGDGDEPPPPGTAAEEASEGTDGVATSGGGEMPSAVDSGPGGLPPAAATTVAPAEGSAAGQATMLPSAPVRAPLISGVAFMPAVMPGVLAGRPPPVPPALPLIPPAVLSVLSAVPTAAPMAVTLTVPPPEVQTIVDKMVEFIKRNGRKFEETVRTREKGNPRFAFLHPWNAHHAYYQQRLSEAMGETEQTGSAGDLAPLADATSGLGSETGARFSSVAGASVNGACSEVSSQDASPSGAQVDPTSVQGQEVSSGSGEANKPSHAGATESKARLLILANPKLSHARREGISRDESAEQAEAKQPSTSGQEDSAPEASAGEGVSEGASAPATSQAEAASKEVGKVELSADEKKKERLRRAKELLAKKRDQQRKEQISQHLKEIGSGAHISSAIPSTVAQHRALFTSEDDELDYLRDTSGPKAAPPKKLARVSSSSDEEQEDPSSQRDGTHIPSLLELLNKARAEDAQRANLPWKVEPVKGKAEHVEGGKHERPEYGKSGASDGYGGLSRFHGSREAGEYHDDRVQGSHRGSRRDREEHKSRLSKHHHHDKERSLSPRSERRAPKVVAREYTREQYLRDTEEKRGRGRTPVSGGPHSDSEPEEGELRDTVEVRERVRERVRAMLAGR